MAEHIGDAKAAGTMGSLAGTGAHFVAGGLVEVVTVGKKGFLPGAVR
jgi:hypothetical protein